jgi:hypothetical protein
MPAPTRKQDAGRNSEIVAIVAMKKSVMVYATTKTNIAPAKYANDILNYLPLVRSFQCRGFRKLAKRLPDVLSGLL